MCDSFTKALGFALKWEGGFVDNPSDPGGATNKGITQKVYDDFRASQSLSQQSVKSISSSEVEWIYKNNYWFPSGADRMPPRIAVIHFDTSVNLGVRQAVLFLQRCLMVKDDGVLGSRTYAALYSTRDIEHLADQYLTYRENFYISLAQVKPQMAIFLKGWLNRTHDLRIYA